MVHDDFEPEGRDVFSDGPPEVRDRQIGNDAFDVHDSTIALSDSPRKRIVRTGARWDAGLTCCDRGTRSSRGTTSPASVGGDAADLRRQHSETAVRWLARTRDVEHRGAWCGRVIDALCGPPESFPLTQIVAHDLTFSADWPDKSHAGIWRRPA
ncbi:hypothetical protein GCM10022294_30440 [Dietzia aurantiaca]